MLGIVPSLYVAEMQRIEGVEWRSSTARNPGMRVRCVRFVSSPSSALRSFCFDDSQRVQYCSSGANRHSPTADVVQHVSD